LGEKSLEEDPLFERKLGTGTNELSLVVDWRGPGLDTFLGSVICASA